jgi:anti-sigma regulatory factor (Ser/Thr protein kinase)
MNLIAEHRLRNDPSETPQVGHWVIDFARRAGLTKEVQNAVDLSLTEWITNVIAYAYDGTREHWITIRFQKGDGEVRVEVEDDGRLFDPLMLPPADVTAPLEGRPIGGLGVHMMRKLMDTVLYRREGERNILTLVKRIA